MNVVDHRIDPTMLNLLNGMGAPSRFVGHRRWTTIEVGDAMIACPKRA